MTSPIPAEANCTTWRTTRRKVQQVRRDLEAKIRAKLKEIQDPVLAELWQ